MNIRVHDTLRGGDQKAARSDRWALALDDGGFPWVSVMPHMMHGRIRRTGIRRRKLHSRRTGTLRSRLGPAPFEKLRPTGCFSVSGECELMKYGPREYAHVKTTAPELCRPAKRA